MWDRILQKGLHCSESGNNQIYSRGFAAWNLGSHLLSSQYFCSLTSEDIFRPGWEAAWSLNLNQECEACGLVQYQLCERREGLKHQKPASTSAATHSWFKRGGKEVKHTELWEHLRACVTPEGSPTQFAKRTDELEHLQGVVSYFLQRSWQLTFQNTNTHTFTFFTKHTTHLLTCSDVISLFLKLGKV